VDPYNYLLDAKQDIVDPMLRAFAVTNLEKTDSTSSSSSSSSSSSGDNKAQWAWRINVEAIYKSLTALAKFDVNGGTDAAASGLKYGGDTLYVAGNSCATTNLYY
jgi:hypothetical protein